MKLTIHQQNSSVHTEVDDYFRRIGYQGQAEASLEFLKSIHFLHPQAIPFENLNPFLRIPVSLDTGSIVQKLVHGGRGGYCFEHNLLLSHVLKAAGFKVKGLAARVLWNAPEGTVTPRGHMLLLVEAEHKLYIADVGFGGLTLTAPLLLETDIEQQTPHEIFRLVKDNEDFMLQAQIKDEWKTLYKFNLQEQFLPDYEVTNWYLSNHPRSHFVTGLIAALSLPGKRYALRNTNLSIHHSGGDTEKIVLSTPEDIENTLVETFGINLPENSNLKQALEKLIQMEAEV